MTDAETRGAALARLLEQYERIAICGGPRTGKTKLAESVRILGESREVVHTDAFIKLAWVETPPALIAKCATLSRFIIEGVQAARALRAGLVVDAVLYLDKPMVPQSKGQASMSKAVATVFAEWRAGNLSVHVESPDL